MHTIVIDSDKCKQDGICVAECPRTLFKDNASGVPELVAGAGEACIGCGHCAAVCPGQAISLDGLAGDGLEATAKSALPSREEVRALFRSRRSIRAYKAEPVEKGVLEELLDLARWAPTAKNCECVHWTVLNGREKVVALGDLVIDWARTLPAMADGVAQYEGGYDMIFRGAPCVLVAHAPTAELLPASDCAIALTTLEAAAPAFGLGGCWAGYFMMAAANHPPVVEHLALPEGHTVYGALFLGVPKYRYPRIPERGPVKANWL